MNDAVALVFCAVLFVGGIFVLGVGAWVWSRAAQEMVRARAHRNQADTEEFTMRSAQRAVEQADETVERTRSRLPTSDEVAQWQRYQTAMEQAAETPDYPDTRTNAGEDLEDETFQTGIYATPSPQREGA